MCAGVCVCEVVCVSLGMTRSETSQAVSYALSPISVDSSNSYTTPQYSWCFQKKNMREYVLTNCFWKFVCWFNVKDTVLLRYSNYLLGGKRVKRNHSC